MQNQQENINENTLFLALTRPPMMMGVTMECLMINLSVMMCLFILLASFWTALLFVSIHFTCVELFKHDKDWFSLGWTKCPLPQNPNKQYWGVKCYEPF